MNNPSKPETYATLERIAAALRAATLKVLRSEAWHVNWTHDDNGRSAESLWHALSDELSKRRGRQ